MMSHVDSRSPIPVTLGGQQRHICTSMCWLALHPLEFRFTSRRAIATVPYLRTGAAIATHTLNPCCCNECDEPCVGPERRQRYYKWLVLARRPVNANVIRDDARSPTPILASVALSHVLGLQNSSMTVDRTVVGTGLVAFAVSQPAIRFEASVRRSSPAHVVFPAGRMRFSPGFSLRG